MFVVILIPLAIGIMNYEFFEQVKEEVTQGAVWQYVGKQAPDPKAKSLPLRNTLNGKPVGDPFIVWKLKLEK